MNILVTGGAGYIGSVCTEHLLTRGHHVVVLDNLRTGHRAAVPPAATFYYGDIRDGELVRTIVDTHHIDAVLHFAAVSLVGESMAQPLMYFRENTAASLTFFDHLISAGVQKIIFSSTATVYGTPDTQPIPETSPVRIENVYGETKWTIERALKWLRELSGIGFAALRYFNACGASATRGEDHTPETHLIPLVLEVAAGKRDHIAIFGNDYPTPDGTNIRDYVHVLDLAHAHALAVEALQPGEERVYNIGLGRGYSVQEVVEACRAVTGKHIAARVTERRAGDPPTLVASNERITTELGWEPQFTELTHMIETAWHWHRSHPAGYASTRFADGEKT